MKNESEIKVVNSKAKEANLTNNTNQFDYEDKGKKHSRFNIKKLLGEGSFSKLYLAYDNVLEKDVALKVEKKDKLKKILLYEFEVLKSLHKSICTPRIYDFIYGKTLNFIVMELLGMNLSNFKKAFEPSELICVELLSKMFDCIEEVHSLGYVHRDIKPSNFVLSSNYRNENQVFLALKEKESKSKDNNAVVALTSNNNSSSNKINYEFIKNTKIYLIDFGLSKSHLDKNGHVIKGKKHNDFRGTLIYASLNAHQKKELGRRDDLWSFFFVLLEYLRIDLPWRELSLKMNKEEVGKTKELCLNNPQSFLLDNINWKKQLSMIFNHLSTLSFEDKPDYTIIRKALEDIKTQILINESNETDSKRNENNTVNKNVNSTNISNNISRLGKGKDNTKSNNRKNSLDYILSALPDEDEGKSLSLIENNLENLSDELNNKKKKSNANNSQDDINNEVIIANKLLNDLYEPTETDRVLLRNKREYNDNKSTDLDFNLLTVDVPDIIIEKNKEYLSNLIIVKSDRDASNINVDKYSLSSKLDKKKFFSLVDLYILLKKDYKDMSCLAKSLLQYLFLKDEDNHIINNKGNSLNSTLAFNKVPYLKEFLLKNESFYTSFKLLFDTNYLKFIEYLKSNKIGLLKSDIDNYNENDQVENKVSNVTNTLPNSNRSNLLFNLAISKEKESFEIVQNYITSTKKPNKLNKHTKNKIQKETFYSKKFNKLEDLIDSKTDTNELYRKAIDIALNKFEEEKYNGNVGADNCLSRKKAIIKNYLFELNFNCDNQSKILEISRNSN